MIPRRFDPIRSFMTPKSVLAKIGPNPRIISDDVWAKLVWAGLNLTAEDLPKRRQGPENSYPVEMCKALFLTWLFAGLRNNEIVRLRLGCIRGQKEEVSIPGATEKLPRSSVCMLEVPVNKTSTAFTKPVDPIVGEAINAWEKVRPQGEKQSDPKTGEMVEFLFLYRLTVIGQGYLNDVLIPTLCRKAGVPRADVRGTGIPMEFQFGTNWAQFSRLTGGVIGQPLAMEGTFSFFLESAFLGLFLYGEKRLGKWGHWWAGFLVFLGSWISGFFIIVADPWMQHPVAYTRLSSGGFSVSSFWGLLTNPWALIQYAHNMSGAVVTGAFVMASVGAFYLLQQKFVEHAHIFLRVGVVAGIAASLWQVFPSGDLHGKYMARNRMSTNGFYHTAPY